MPSRIVERAALTLGRDVPSSQHKEVDLLASAFEALSDQGLKPEKIQRDRAPPPRLIGTSCVYAFSTSEGLYVGETDSVRDRLKKHGRTYDVGDALVVTVKDKSAARKAEATALKKLQALGVPLLSTSDASNVHFGGA